MRYLPASFCVALVLAVLTGCTTVQVPTAGNRGPYVLKRHLAYPNYWAVDVDAGIDDAWQATLAGLDDLRIEPETKRCDQLVGVVTGELADGQPLRLELRSLTGETTQLLLRVGTLGDQERVVRIFTAIDAHL